MQVIVATLLRELLKKLDAETVKDVTDRVLDIVEDKITATPNKWDDATIQPLIDQIRVFASIEDKKYGADKVSA